MATKPSIAKRTLKWLQAKASSKKDIADVKYAKEAYKRAANTASLPGVSSTGKKTRSNVAGFKQNDAKLRQTLSEVESGTRKLSDSNVASLKELLDGKNGLSYTTRAKNMNNNKTRVKEAVDTQRHNANKRLVKAGSLIGVSTLGIGGHALYKSRKKKATVNTD